jgi:hypothetical protein
MSAAIQCLNCPSFSVVPSSAGFGSDSIDLFKSLIKGIGHIWEPVNLGGPLEDALRSLIELYLERSKANWDGYNAFPITEDAVFDAWKLIKLLPLSIPMPEILAEPNGEIGLEWYKERRLVFVVSVSGKRTLTYAGLFGSNTIHGVENLVESLPPVVVDSLRRLFYS